MKRVHKESLFAKAPRSTTIGQRRARQVALVALALTSLLVAPARGSSTQASSSGARSVEFLDELDSALKTLAAKVAPSVVQIMVSGYTTSVGAGGEDEEDAVIEREYKVGSGVILDADGYIITNAHVVSGAERVEVLVTVPDGDRDEQASNRERNQSLLPAVVVGTTEDFDLALLKIEASSLRALPLADYRQLMQGQLALAVGSPFGLENSVTLGVLSSTARQPDPDTSLVFVQTDAPINPGNSGGALVDMRGALIGINTFILSQAGGSEGLGFAIPAPIVSYAYQRLRERGHVERRTVGLSIQLITPTLAKALGLNRFFGLIVSDVLPGGPGERSGVEIGDIVLAVNGSVVTSPAELQMALYADQSTAHLDVEVLRGTERIPIRLEPVDVPPEEQTLLDRLDVARDSVPELGILAQTVTPEVMRSLGELRIRSGVIVIARESNGAADIDPIDLIQGDVIHSLNEIDIDNLDTLRRSLASLRKGDPVVLQVEREGALRFVSFLMN